MAAADELEERAGLLGLPISGVPLPGVAVGTARQLPPPPHMAQRGSVIGVSTYPGMTNRPVALKRLTTGYDTLLCSA